MKNIQMTDTETEALEAGEIVPKFWRDMRIKIEKYTKEEQREDELHQDYEEEVAFEPSPDLLDKLNKKRKK